MTAAGFGYAAALALAVLFMWAGAAKLADRAGTRAAFDALGVPGAAAAAGGLPIAEAVISILLVTLPWVGGALALASLAFFSALIATRLRSGVSAPCACFGSSSDQDISWIDLVRNGLLAVLGFAALGAPEPTRPTAVDWVVLAVALLAGAALISQLRGTATSRTTPPDAGR